MNNYETADRPRRILRLAEVEQRTGRSRSALYRDMAARRFPPAVKIGPRAIGWPESLIEGWIAERERAAAQAVRTAPATA